MNSVVDLAAILAPIPGDNPAGESLRYSPVYEEIKEARRSDDSLDRGDWQCETKAADWNRVVALAIETLTRKTKDLQIAAWLLEGLVKTEGLRGLGAGLRILTGLMRQYWSCVYPEIDEGDLEYRSGPIELVNDKLWICVKQIPLTDVGVTPGYSLLKWEESRQVGYDADTRNRYGDVDEEKKRKRDELIAEGKITAEEFDSAVTASSRAYYEASLESLIECREAFKILDQTVDELFGASAPRLAELGRAIEESERLVGRIVKEKREREPAAEPPAQRNAAAEPVKEVESAGISCGEVEEGAVSHIAPLRLAPGPAAASFVETGSLETARWEQALHLLGTTGIKQALEVLFEASCSAPSVRERSRYRLLMARLCLKAERSDLARPLVEELYGLIEELHLERWESPTWVAEVLDAFYQCLMWGEPSDEDIQRARELLKKLCTTDVTRAMSYRL